MLCSRCGFDYPIAEFRRGHGTICRECRNKVVTRRRRRRTLNPGRVPTSTWPADRVDMLVALFQEGLPAFEIGRRMGVTKNAIIGQLYRRGYQRRQTQKIEQRAKTFITSPTGFDALHSNAWLREPLAGHHAMMEAGYLEGQGEGAA